MKIFILGNSGTGKSALIEELVREVPADVIAVDDYRMQYGNFRWDGEQKAVREFINAITFDNQYQIIECSGAGRTGEMLRRRMLHIKSPMLVCILIADPSLCIQRTQNKFWGELKMPQQKIDTIRQNIKNSLSIRSFYRGWNWLELPNENVTQQLRNVALIRERVAGGSVN